MTERILITGGAGFLGSHLSEKLLEDGYRVRVLDSFASGKEDNLKHIRDRLELVRGSISDEILVNDALRGVSTVIHAAFPMDLRRRALDGKLVAGVLQGLFNVLKGAIKNDVRVVYISSIAVYGNQRYVPMDEKHPLEPVLLHGALKLAGEEFCRVLAKSHGLKMIILRVADIYGPRNTRVSVPIRFLQQALKNEPITVFGDGTQSRTYTYVGDFAAAVSKLLSVPEAEGEIMNYSTGHSVTMYDLARLVKEVTGSKSEIRLLIDTPVEDRKLVIDNTKIKAILGSIPVTPLKEGLAFTARWLQNNPNFY